MLNVNDFLLFNSEPQKSIFEKTVPDFVQPRTFFFTEDDPRLKGKYTILRHIFIFNRIFSLLVRKYCFVQVQLSSYYGIHVNTSFWLNFLKGYIS